MQDEDEFSYFDKFVENIVERERQQERRQPTEQEAAEQETPQRKYARLHRERWQNQIRWRRSQ